MASIKGWKAMYPPIQRTSLIVTVGEATLEDEEEARKSAEYAVYAQRRPRFGVEPAMGTFIVMDAGASVTKTLQCATINHKKSINYSFRNLNNIVSLKNIKYRG
jgi:hypothetical protein